MSGSVVLITCVGSNGRFSVLLHEIPNCTNLKRTDVLTSRDLSLTNKTMIVCIAEKPSVARDIAEILGAKTRKDGIY